MNIVFHVMYVNIPYIAVPTPEKARDLNQIDARTA
jgi:hypothetical protein